MKKEFSFLQDERALYEIRKHKWIESQKAKREIGFATAALDWIKRYGEAWKKAHLKKDRDYNLLLERRKFRRYKKDFDLRLNKDNTCIAAKVKELSFAGLLCYSKEFIPVSQVVLMRFNLQGQRQDDFSCIQCKGIVNRVEHVSSQGFEIFLRLDETGQRYIEDKLLVS